MKKRILDMCCGSRMFYFDKHDPNVLFTDIREYHDTLCDGRKLDVQPDMIADCTDLPFEDETFNMVVFDPPHLLKVGEVLKAIKDYKPIFGHRTTIKNQTIWMAFMKW